LHQEWQGGRTPETAGLRRVGRSSFPAHSLRKPQRGLLKHQWWLKVLPPETASVSCVGRRPRGSVRGRRWFAPCWPGFAFHALASPATERAWVEAGDFWKVYPLEGSRPWPLPAPVRGAICVCPSPGPLQPGPPGIAVGTRRGTRARGRRTSGPLQGRCRASDEPARAAARSRPSPLCAAAPRLRHPRSIG
jgi:hypothetical protein